jgi:hypothetical protein
VNEEINTIKTTCKGDEGKTFILLCLNSHSPQQLSSYFLFSYYGTIKKFKFNFRQQCERGFKTFFIFVQ